MKKINVILGILLSISVFVSSCKDDDHSDNTATITIDEPVAESMYDQGDTVFVRGSITASEAMHGWEVELTDEAAAQLFYTEEHDHAATYAIDTFWVNNVSVTQHVTIKVTATIDHDGNTSSKEVEVHCHQ